jgi:clan AA aspartic protease, TIGR02281 family
METQLNSNNPHHNNIESKDRRLGALFIVIAWLIIISLVAILTNFSLFGSKAPMINETSAGTTITIYRDHDFHFRLDGFINSIAVTFLIDTGATSVAIPTHIAKLAKLPELEQVGTSTANGDSFGYFTVVNQLNIGTIKFNNVSAIIVPNMDSNQVLLGMNVLQHLNLQQIDDTLVITVPALKP